MNLKLDYEMKPKKKPSSLIFKLSIYRKNYCVSSPKVLKKTNQTA